MRRLVLVLFVVACKRPTPPPSCTQIIDHALALMGQVQAKGPAKNHDEMDLSNKKAMVQLCEQRHLTEEQARCMLEAPTLEVLNACRPAPPRPRLPNAGSGSASAGTPPAPAGSGSAP